MVLNKKSIVKTEFALFSRFCLYFRNNYGFLAENEKGEQVCK